MRKISFITANYVARALKYNGDENWGTHDQATVRAASPENFQAMAADIAAAGFQAIDIWVAHCDWRQHNQGDYVEQVKGICSQFDLEITSYAGGLTGKSAADAEAQLTFMKRLGAPIFAGGMGGGDPARMTPIVDEICQKLGVRWALENHPEKSVEEILAKIGQGKYKNVGVALDTGWCGTQGMDAVEAAKRLRDKLFIVHLKDITKPGGHETCALGEGVVPVENVVRYLVQSGWQGTICIEHEPYNRDPMPEVIRSYERLEEWLR